MQGAYAALLLSALPFLWPLLSGAGWIAVACSALLVVLVEVVTVVAVHQLIDHAPSPVRGRNDPDFTLDVDAVQVRHATVADNAGTEQVYLEWFSADLSIEDTEYAAILKRGGHVRIAEYICSDGTRKIEGYYSVWPMSREVYEDLKSGKIAEKDFHAGLILPVGATQADVLYVSEICALSDRLVD